MKGVFVVTILVLVMTACSTGGSSIQNTQSKFVVYDPKTAINPFDATAVAEESKNPRPVQYAENATVSISYPKETKQGELAEFRIKIVNNSANSFPKVRLIFDSSTMTAAEGIFQGFEFESSVPTLTGSKLNYDGKYANMDFNDLAAHSTQDISFTLRAIKPGTYGANFEVFIFTPVDMDPEDKAISWTTQDRIYLVVKS